MNHNNIDKFFATFFFGLFCGSAIFLLYAPSHKQGYQQGQIDALSGKIHYRQVEYKKWEEIPPTSEK